MSWRIGLWAQFSSLKILSVCRAIALLLFPFRCDYTRLKIISVSNHPDQGMHFFTPTTKPKLCQQQCHNTLARAMVLLLIARSCDWPPYNLNDVKGFPRKRAPRAVGIPPTYFGVSRAPGRTNNGIPFHFKVHFINWVTSTLSLESNRKTRFKWHKQFSFLRSKRYLRHRKREVYWQGLIYRSN